MNKDLAHKGTGARPGKDPEAIERVGYRRRGCRTRLVHSVKSRTAKLGMSGGRQKRHSGLETRRAFVRMIVDVGMQKIYEVEFNSA